MKNFSIAGLFLSLFGLAGGVCATPAEGSDSVLPTMPMAHIAPTIRSSALPRVPAAALAKAALTPFLNVPVVLDAATLATAPHIVAAPTGRTYLGMGDKIDVRGELHGVSEFRIVRPGRRLLDPLSKDYLGDEAMPVGTASLLASAHAGRADGTHAFLIAYASREITVGDRLIALPREATRMLVPHGSSAAVNALVVSIADDAEHAAQHQIVAINKGARDHLSEGVLLSLSAAATDAAASAHGTGAAIQTSIQTSLTPQTRQRPEEERGRLLIVRVFDRVSYGLITQAGAPVQVGDKARAPQHESMDNKDVE